mgnify:CR=1 FL=1
MSGIVRNMRAGTRKALPILAVVSVALLAGCAKRDSITVGSVPDDYRTNHPIVIAEKEEILDLPVASSDRGLTRPQKTAIAGFMAGYDRSAAPVVTVIVPVGSANDVAGSYMSNEIAMFAPSGRPRADTICPTTYHTR